MESNIFMEWLTEGIPLGDWADALVSFLRDYPLIFNAINNTIEGIATSFEWLLFLLPEWLLILVLAGFTLWLTRKWALPVVLLLGLGLIWNLDFWELMIYTLSLVLTAALVSIVVGIPIGIWAARNRVLQNIVTPILDFMQTMPAFVYLIPAVFFFGIGTVPGIVASIIFAMPPTIRLTILGIQQVPSDLIEASDAFGSTGNQKLFKIQLPLAKPTIMAGINQTLMLSLSMVVIASMIGARGLGREVYQAVTQADIGSGFEAGLGIVILAILLDRITQNLGNRQKRK